MLRAFQKTLLTSCLLMSFGSAYAVTATESVIKGVSGFLCLGRLFQGQPNEAALCI